MTSHGSTTVSLVVTLKVFPWVANMGFSSCLNSGSSDSSSVTKIRKIIVNWVKIVSVVHNFNSEVNSNELNIRQFYILIFHILCHLRTTTLVLFTFFLMLTGAEILSISCCAPPLITRGIVRGETRGRCSSALEVVGLIRGVQYLLPWVVKGGP